MIETKNWIVKNWQIIMALLLVVFNVGYTVARIENKPDRTEVKDEIVKAIDNYDRDNRENYIEIKKVPGLKETLDSINDRLRDLQNRFEKVEDKIYLRK